MRYLRRYNESVVDEDTLKEICYDLTDTGKFKVDFSNNRKPSGLRTDLNLGGRELGGFVNISLLNHGLFTYDDVEDVILRLKDYIGDKYIRTMMMCGNNDKWSRISKISNIYRVIVIYDMGRNRKFPLI